MSMNAEALARVERLKDYCRKRKICLSDGEVSPSLMAAKMEAAGFSKNVNYYRDVLDGRKESFGAKVARDFEQGLGMTRWYLDGGADWPFEGIDYDKVLTLDPAEIRRLEGAMLLTAGQMRIDISTTRKSNGTTG